MSNSSKPSASVIAAGIVAILGGLMFLLTGSLGLLGILLGSSSGNPEFPPFLRSTALLGMALLTGLAIFGIATGICLLLLRNWARISALVWAGLSIFFGAAGMVVIFVSVLPQPENLPPQAAAFFHVTLAAVYGVPFLIGVWWLVLLNRKAIKSQFTGPGVPADLNLAQKPRCPTPVAVLAWIFIASILNLLILPFLPFRMPLLVFGHLFSGPTGTIGLTLSCLLLAAAGIGLLKLKPWSYHLMIGMQLFWLASGTVTVLSPNYKSVIDSLTSQIENSMPLPQSGFPSFHYSHQTGWGAAIGLLFVVAVLGILLYYRRRFFELAAAATNA